MLWIERIALTNWLRFEGDHELLLGPKVYAICAEKVDDPERSNFLGKTSLLEAIWFALYGTHRHDREDDWITHGQREGSVTLTLSDGAMIRRSRKRGKSTQLLVEGSAQKEAQRMIDDTLVGMTEADSVATWYFAQRELPRVVLQTPAERMKTVGAWLELEPLQRCEERARGILSEIGDHLRQLRRDEEMIIDQMNQFATAYGMEEDERSDDRDQMAGFLQTARKILAETEQALVDAGEGAERLTKWRQAKQLSEQFDAIVTDGKQTRRELDATWDDDVDPDRQMGADHIYREAVKGVGVARTELEQKRQLARGKFDGTCPVGDCPCPIVDDLNAQREKNADLHAATSERFATLQDEAIRLQGEAETIDERKRERDRLLYRVEDLRAKAAKLLPAHELIKEIGSPPEDDDSGDIEQLRLDRDSVALEAAGLERDLARFDELAARLEELRAEQVDIRERLAIARQAAWIFGRDGAQKRAAEQALAVIEHGANARLRQCEIDLTVSVRWGRTHSSKLAEQCEGCGGALPASKRVKECPDCGAERGPKVIPRLDVALSDRSGAADDIGGMAFQLSASDWLRTERDTRWGLACIDEAVAQCDARHRQQIGSHLATMLSGSFRQALVVSHDRAFTDMMPGRIIIHADDKRSWIGSVC